MGPVPLVESSSSHVTTAGRYLVAALYLQGAGSTQGASGQQHGG